MPMLNPTSYHFDGRKTANWSITQEKTISQDYPFFVHDEPVDQYVQRTYLQFLWLPESLMPLHLLIPSLRRVNVASTSNSDASIHPMHALLDPLLLTTRSSTNKYRVELPRILINGGGAGEMEETTMWYAVAHEKPDESISLPDHAEGPWVDERWREEYLERMERREVQIQILLYLYKISLPGPFPPAKKTLKRKKQPVEPVTTPEDHLEAFMDKLSMWQLVGSLDRATPATNEKKANDRDWTQVFAEDIVERFFKPQQPEFCSLLRSKLFPSSPFSDDEDDDLDNPADALSRQPSPEPVRQTLLRAPSTSRHPSPALSSSSRTTTTTALKSHAASTTRELVRSRSRSLSVSLAKEQQERERASIAPTKKRILNREVSMSRVFKPKPRPRTAEIAKTEVLPAPKPKLKDADVILVDDTPQKPRVASKAGLSFARQPSFGVAKLPGLLKVAEAEKARGERIPAIQEVEGDGDEEWMMDSSPNIVLLNPPRSSSVSSGLTGMDSDDDDDDVNMGQATPSKPSRAVRRR